MENFDRIKRYLLNQLTKEDRKQFEAEARENDALAKELELQRFEMETIDQIEADHLKKKAAKLRLQRSEGHVPNSRSARTIRMYRILAAAAAITLVIGFFFWQGDTVNSDITAFSYQQARVEYEATNVNRGEKADAIFEQTFVNILENRQEDQASMAIDYFLNFKSDSLSTRTRATLNLGHAYLLNQDFLKASETFEGIQQIPDATATQLEEAAFFRAVALIEAGETNSAREILEKLSREGKGYDAVAKNLLSRILGSD